MKRLKFMGGFVNKFVRMMSPSTFQIWLELHNFNLDFTF